MKLFYLVLFGILGVLARYEQGVFVAQNFSHIFPLGTFSTNLMGAFLIGVISVIGLELALIPTELRIGIMVGFLGGYTTFSSYCLESINLIENGHYLHAFCYFVISPILGFILTLCGIFLTRYLFLLQNRIRIPSLPHQVLSGNQSLFRIFINESDTHSGKSLYLFIIEKAREKGLAGCSAFVGNSGFGIGETIRSDFLPDYAVNLPVILELVDKQKNLTQFVKEIEPYLKNTLITEEKLHVHHYRHKK